MQKWNKITVRTNKAGLDTACAVVSMVDEGLLIDDCSDLKVDDMYGELIDESVLNADPDKVSVSIFLDGSENPLDAVAFISDRLSSSEIAFTCEIEGVKEEDWSQTWKKYYHPVSVGSITVVPMWEEYTPRDGEITVKMDPGMAFGTGTHETTRLAMALMQRVKVDGARVLDIGTGSGILAICASKLGAHSCLATDIDPNAVRVARENAERDGAENIECIESNLLSAVPKNRKYDVIIANIVTDIILRLLPDMGEHMSEGGAAILSGIIEDRYPDIVSALDRCGFRITLELSENDWRAMLIERV